MRERSSKIYHVSTYYLANSLAELPNAILFNTIYGTIVYWMVGFYPTVERFFFFLLILVLQSLAMQAYGLLISIATPTFPIANTIGTFVTTAMALVSGFFIKVGSVPYWGIWLTYISVQYYAFYALVLNEFDGRTFDCPMPPEQCLEPYGETVIQNLSLDRFIILGRWECVGFLVLISLVARIIAFLLLRFVRKPRSI